MEKATESPSAKAITTRSGLPEPFGAKVAVTTGSPEKLATCQQLGADILINYREEDFAEVLKNKVDVILDMVGGEYFERNLSLLKLRGRLVFIATLGGTQATFNIGALMRRRLRLMGDRVLDGFDRLENIRLRRTAAQKGS